MKIDIINIVDLVRSSDFKGGGEFIELAKGKHQLVSNWSGFIRKVGRILYRKI